MTVFYRQAVPSDAAAASDMLMRLEAAGKRTIPSTPAYVKDSYIERDTRVSCMLALEGPRVLGLQVLSRAWPNNPYGVPEGMGVIGTHIDPDQARRGIGRTLFQHTLSAARDAGVAEIDAWIGAGNEEALGYYAAMGFRTVAMAHGRVSKRLTVQQ